jgi:hypothetical protein
MVHNALKAINSHMSTAANVMVMDDLKLSFFGGSTPYKLTDEHFTEKAGLVQKFIINKVKFGHLNYDYETKVTTCNEVGLSKSNVYSSSTLTCLQALISGEHSPKEHLLQNPQCL